MAKTPVAGVDKIVAVASGKGGVGKTTVTVNLALALSSLGRRVGVFDADLYGPNVPLLLGVTRRQPATSTLIPVARKDPQPYIEPLERHGLRLMSFALLVGEKDTLLPDPRFAGMMVERTLRDVKWTDGPAHPPLDILLVDLPPGSGEPQQSLVESLPIDGVVAVTTPQDMALMDTGRSLGLYRKAGVPILGLVENMAYLVCPNCDERVDLFHSTDRPWEAHSVPTLARLPLDPALSQPSLPDAVPQLFRNLAVAIAARL